MKISLIHLFIKHYLIVKQKNHLIDNSLEFNFHLNEESGDSENENLSDSDSFKSCDSDNQLESQSESELE